MNEKFEHPQVEYERSDLSALAILGFLAGLALVGLVMHIILAGMFSYLDNYTKRRQAATNPLLPTTTVDLRNPGPKVANEFPLPRLETNELGQLDDQRLAEEKVLATYGWVDQNAGIAHIPIERAIELVASRGLPVESANLAGNAKTTEAPARAGRARRQEEKRNEIK